MNELPRPDKRGITNTNSVLGQIKKLNTIFDKI